jgi:hypothetical protein
MEFSLPGWLGALAGTVIAVAVYLPAIRAIERRLRLQRGPATLDERDAIEQKLSIVRRLILGIDISVFAVAGYWIGNLLSAASNSHPKF